MCVLPAAIFLRATSELSLFLGLIREPVANFALQLVHGSAGRPPCRYGRGRLEQEKNTGYEEECLFACYAMLLYVYKFISYRRLINTIFFFVF